MLILLTLAVMLIVAYSYFREGMLTALTMLVNILLAGVVTFNFFEPLANALESSFEGSFLAGFEDAICLFGLFAASLGLLRLVTNNLANHELQLPAMAQQIGASLVGLVAGYLLAGFLFCMVQTLPLPEKFMDFDYEAESGGAKLRRFVPPDRVWLALMSKIGAGPLSQSDAVTFDPEATFELRYARLRRIKEQQQPQPQN
jgi:hypothetical protein